MVDEMKQIRKMLKKEMLKAGIKNFTVQQGRGTGWDWTHIEKKQNKNFDAEWTQKEQKTLQEDFGYSMGHPANSLMGKPHKIKAMLYGHKAMQFKKSALYQDFKSDFRQEGMKVADGGTCVGGSGTIIKRKGKPIDFFRSMGQGETRNWVAEKIMKKRAKKLGLELEHEGGWMD